MSRFQPTSGECMVTKDYGHTESLDAFVGQAVEDVKNAGFIHNLCIQVSFDKKLIQSDQLCSCEALAGLWQAPIHPKELYFNHGEYIGCNGIPYIIEELSRKPSSNRALYSLISQKHILKLRNEDTDRPIPSFMVLQCGIDGSRFYCTTYFRALEVSEFLKINVAEIKLVLSQVLREFSDVKEVVLTIFSFSAYATEGFNALQRPKLDWLEKEDLPGIFLKGPAEIGRLLQEKARPSSVIEVTSLAALQRIIDNDQYKNSKNEGLNRGRIRNLLLEAISAGTALQDLRRRHSKHEEIDNLQEEFITLLNLTAREFLQQ